MKKTKYKYAILLFSVSMLVIVGLSSEVLWAKPSFREYELQPAYNEFLCTDFDGDGLDDIIAVAEPNLVFFFQDPKLGFAMEADLVYSLGDKPFVVWPAKLPGRMGQNLLLMSDSGISSLAYVDKTSPPTKSRIISRQTIIPEKCETSSIINFTLSASTIEEFPLIFIPTENELEIWKYDKKWQHVQSLRGMPEIQTWGPNGTSGYIKQYWINMNIGDLNGDSLEDLVMCEENNGKVLYKIYFQTKEGLFASKPYQCFEDEWDWRTWICLKDIDKDGNVDIIKNTWLEEPWFFQGTFSGKVLVQIFISDTYGNIPFEPTFLFRKNDWISSMPVLDIDGDGFIDLILGYNRFVDIEKVRKTLFSKKLDHSFRIHFYDNGFHEKPGYQKSLTIQLHQSGLHIDLTQREYLETQICFDGDFDGDGDKDLLVKDRNDKASVYFFLSRKKGFSKKPNIQFSIKRVKFFIVEDLNEDGVSDLVVLGHNRDSFKVFLSKRK